jgi:hypothetical protein
MMIFCQRYVETEALFPRWTADSSQIDILIIDNNYPADCWFEYRYMQPNKRSENEP